MSVNNEDRADWAEQSVKTFLEVQQARLNFDEMGYEDQEDSITDLICDLLHLARSKNFDIEKMVKRATNHFEEEVVEEIDLPDDEDESPTISPHVKVSVDLLVHVKVPVTIKSGVQLHQLPGVIDQLLELGQDDRREMAKVDAVTDPPMEIEIGPSELLEPPQCV